MGLVYRKKYLKIREVSNLTDLKPHVLRFWEGEFSSIRPKRTESGQRLYRRKDVEAILEIKSLLHDERYTIEGAKKMMGAKGKEREGPTISRRDLLKGIVDELRQIRAMA